MLFSCRPFSSPAKRGRWPEGPVGALRQVDAAADVDGLSGDVAAIGTGEMPDHGRYVLGLTAARSEDRSRLAMRGFFAIAFGFDETGRDEIDGDLAGRKLHRQR